MLKYIKWNRAIAIILVVTILSLLILSIYGESSMLPYHQDDFIYLNSGNQFVLNGSLKAYCFFENKVSRIGQFNWYGPGLSLIYGLVLLPFGTEFPTIIILSNIIILCTIYLLLKKYISDFELVWVAFFASGLTNYIFSFYPVLLFFLCSVILGIEFFKYLNYKNHLQKSIFSFRIIALILLFALFVRTTFFLWVFLLIPRRFSFNEIKIYIIQIIFVFLVVSIFSLYFCAPANFSQFKRVFYYLKPFDLKLFIYSILMNLKRNIHLLLQTFELKHFYFVLTFLSSIILFLRNTHSRLNFSLVCFNYISLFFYLALYTGDMFYLEKQLLSNISINILVLIYRLKNRLNSIYFLVLTILIGIQFYYTLKRIEKQKNAFTETKNNRIIKDLQKVLDIEPLNGEQIIAWNYNEFYNLAQKERVSFDLLFGNLPLSNFESTEIRYSATFDLENDKKNNSFSYFISDNEQIKHDFILCTKQVNLGDDYELLKCTEFFRLYEIKNKVNNIN